MRLRTCLLCAFPALLALAATTPSCAIYDTSLLLDAPAAGAGGTGNEGGSNTGGTDTGGSAGDAGAGQAGDAGANQAGQGGASTGGSAGASAGNGGAGQSGAGNGGSAGSAGTGGSAGAPECSDPSQCDDKNPCTNDGCDAGSCSHTNDDTLVPEQLAGNCKAEICSAGQATDTIDDKDLPTDEGEPCTQETCENGVPGKTLLNDVECDLGGKKGYCKTGKCQVDCVDASECDDTNPCTENACTNGKCAFTPLGNDTPTPGASDTKGDCKKSVCQDGKPADTADLADLPTAPSECQTPLCSGSGPSFENKTNGTSCTTGGQLCIDGACKANTCGDGFRLGTEECDGNDLNGKTCADFGFGPGSPGLKCGAGCKLDSSACQGLCGNGVKEPGEDCDDATSPGAPGDGCSKFCKIEPGVGDLVITEIMYNPNAAPTSGSTELGEWFEVYNASSKTYDVRGLQLTSKTAGELHVIDSASPLLIAPGAYATFTRGANSSETTGFEPFYSYGSKLNFSNSSADYIHLEIGTTPPILIDGVDYTPSSTYNGKSYSLNPTKLTAVDNDSSSNFCASKTEFGNPDGVGTKDKGTPGAPNDACP